MTEQCKRIQIRNVLEQKTLQEKIRLFSIEQSYVDKELRQILHAKESLLQSLRRANLGDSPRTAELLEIAGIGRERSRSCQSEILCETVSSDVKVKGPIPRRPSVQMDKKKLDAKPLSDGAKQTIKHLPVNNEQCSLSNAKTIEIKSCLQSGKHEKRHARVRFSFPEVKSEKIIENTEEDGKVFKQRQRQYVYKSHSDCLDDIQVKSKFYQIGSVALATAVFKSNAWQSKRSYSDKVHNDTKKAELKTLLGKNKTVIAQHQAVPKKHTLRRVQSGCLPSEPRRKLLMRRTSMTL